LGGDREGDRNGTGNGTGMGPEWDREGGIWAFGTVVSRVGDAYGESTEVRIALCYLTYVVRSHDIPFSRNCVKFLKFVRFEIFTAVTMNDGVFRYITTCGSWYFFAACVGC
jgi:hypothetical protein